MVRVVNGSGASGQLGGLEAGLGLGVGVPLCPAQLALGVRAVSHTFQAVVRREGRAWGTCGCGGVGSPGSHPRCSHLLRSLAADLHLHACGTGLCRSVWFVGVSAGT